MKDVVTSYYGNYRRIQEAGFSIVQISQGLPKFQSALVKATIPLLAPAKKVLADLRADKIDKAGYEKAYFAQLEFAGAALIQSQLEEAKARHGPIALCCFETLRDETWCHRTMFAAWFKTKTGLLMREL